MFTFALYNFHPYYCLLVFAFGGLWRPNRIIGHLKATLLATLAALATLVALAALVSNVLVFDLHNFHSCYCLLGFASGGLWRPNRITGHFMAISLATLVSNVLIFALPNFHPYYCLLDFASGGLWGPNRVTGHLKATSEFEFIAVGKPAAPPPRSQNTLPTCSNMPYTTFIPIILCLVWPLESSGGLQTPKSPPEAKNEPEIVFSGTPQSDMTVIYRSWAQYSPPTTSGE